MKEKIDRRVRRTREQLRAGLIELMREKSMNEITVKELSDLVDINRGTFYLHYKDIFDMVEQIETELSEELLGFLDCHQKDSQVKTPLPMLTDIFQFLAKNADICTVLLSPYGDISFLSKLEKLVHIKCIPMLRQVSMDAEPMMCEYFFAFILSGCVGIFQTWLNDGMKQSPEEIASIVEQIILHGVGMLTEPLRK